MKTDHADEKAALARAADVLGGQAALALAIGFQDRRRVWQWFSASRRVPAEHCPAIERVTRERGSVVTCEELRPDVDWAVLRSAVVVPAADREAA